MKKMSVVTIAVSALAIAGAAPASADEHTWRGTAPTQQVRALTNGVCFMSGVIRTRRQVSFGTLVAGLIAVALPAAVHAAPHTWTGINPTSSNWSAFSGGSTNWTSGIPTDGDTLTFGPNNSRTTNTNDLNGLSVGSITFSSATSTFNLNGNALGLSGAGTITNTSAPAQNINLGINLATTAEFKTTAGAGALNFTGPIDTGGHILNLTNTGGDIYIDGALSGGGSIFKSGAGTTFLKGTPGYTGNIAVNNGLLLSENNAVQGNIHIESPGTFEFGNNTNGTYSGDIVGAGKVRITANGANVLTMTGTNTYTGGTNLISGSLVGDTDSLQGDIANATSVTFDQKFNDTYGGVMSGTGSLTKANSGTVTLTGANTYTGGTTVSGGTLSIGSSQRLANSGALTVAGGGTFNLGSFTETVGAVTLSSGSITGIGTLFGSNYDVQQGTVGARLAGTGALTKTGAGIVTLTGANTYTGGTTVVAGYLIGTTASLRGQIINNADVTFDQSTDGAFDGAISGTGDVVKQGTGRVVLIGPNSYTGRTAVISGTLAIGNNQQLSDSDVLTVAGGTFDLSVFTETVGEVRLSSGAITGMGTLIGSSYNMSSGTVSAVLGGTGALTKTGTGALTLTGANTYTGGTTVFSGTLSIGFHERLANSGALTVAGEGTFNLGSFTETVGAVTLSSGSITGTGTLFGSNYGVQHGTVGAILGGTGALTKTGSGGTVTLTGANTYTGGTTVSGGTLVLSASERLANSGALAVAGGTLNLGSFTETVSAVTLSSGSITGTGILIGSSYNVQSGTVGARLAGTGALTKTGAGTVTLNGANAYTGGTFINGGLLAVSSETSLGEAADALTFGGGRLRSGNATIIGRNATLNANGGGVDATAGTSWTFSGNIAGMGALTMTGGGVVNLSGANTYTGATTVSAGKLALTGAGAINASVSLDVGQDGMFDVSGKSSSYLYAQDVVNQGVIKGGIGANVFTLSGDVSGAGDYLGNLLFSGTYGPGNSPALVAHEHTTFGADSVLTMELGGLTRGAQYDAIDALTLNLNGTLKVNLIDLMGGANLFAPSLGNFFDLLMAETITGMFTTFDFTGATLAMGLSWSWDVLDIGGFDTFRLMVVEGQVSDAPAPGTLLLFGPGVVLLVAVRRQRGRMPRPGQPASTG